jgi:hypothetical protein
MIEFAVVVFLTIGGLFVKAAFLDYLDEVRK